MSRDWTPREAYYFDKKHYEQYGEHFHQMNLCIEVGGKVVKEYPTEKEKSLAEKYPYLTYTACDMLLEMDNVVREDVLAEMEGYLKELCESDDFKNKVHTGDLSNETINKWYNGKLDSWFYYREQNDQMLLDYLETISSPEELLCETETNEMDL